MNDSKDIHDCISVFVDSVIKQHDSLMLKRSISYGNVQARRRRHAISRLLKYSDDGREALCELLNHDDDDVRSMAAAYLLRYKHEEARKVLEDVAANGHGIAAFGASECLKRWEEGTWQLDPEQPCDQPSDVGGDAIGKQ